MLVIGGGAGRAPPPPSPWPAPAARVAAAGARGGAARKGLRRVPGRRRRGAWLELWGSTSPRSAPCRRRRAGRAGPPGGRRAAALRRLGPAAPACWTRRSLQAAAAGATLHRGCTAQAREPRARRLAAAPGRRRARRARRTHPRHRQARAARPCPRRAARALGPEAAPARLAARATAWPCCPSPAAMPACSRRRRGANLCAAVAARRAPARPARRRGGRLGARRPAAAPTPRPRWGSRWPSPACPTASATATAARPGLYRVGDQAAVIPSFTGDGVAHGAAPASPPPRAILAGQPAAAFHAAWRRAQRRPMRWAGLGAWAMQAGARGFAAAASFAPLARMVARQTRLA